MKTSEPDRTNRLPDCESETKEREKSQKHRRGVACRKVWSEWPGEGACLHEQGETAPSCYQVKGTRAFHRANIRAEERRGPAAANLRIPTDLAGWSASAPRKLAVLFTLKSEFLKLVPLNALVVCPPSKRVALTASV